MRYSARWSWSGEVEEQGGKHFGVEGDFLLCASLTGLVRRPNNQIMEKRTLVHFTDVGIE